MPLLMVTAIIQFTNGQIWANKNIPHVVISIADIQIKEVDKYLRLLETECAK